MSKSALVVVLGEFARSPRMQYHTCSLLDHKFSTEVISCGKEVTGLYGHKYLNTNLKQILLPDYYIKLSQRLPGILSYIIKTIVQAILLIYCLAKAEAPHIILVQNPPSIPTLPVIYLYSRIVGAKLIVDWHNYGYSILALKLGCNNILVKLYRRIEMYFGSLADAAFAVSKTMSEDLVKSHGQVGPIYTVYDRPPNHFHAMDIESKHGYFLCLSQEVLEFRFDRNTADDNYSGCSKTRFTESYIEATMLEGRPKLVVSSTSWTEDEDFSILLKALELYSAKFKSAKLPNILCAITGKGPLKEYYKKKIKELELDGIEILLPWLEFDDYCSLLACADLGVSLHRSSSGCDLPMKVVDMLGSGIPVAAYRYPAIHELVNEDFGMLFHDEQTLLSCLETMLLDEQGDAKFRENIRKKFHCERWSDHWDKEVKPVLQRLLSESTTYRPTYPE